jgi:glc operon protein GlcG
LPKRREPQDAQINRHRRRLGVHRQRLAIRLPTETAPVLTLDIAQKMVTGCQATATEKGWHVNIAIVDAGANLVMFERMNGAPLGSVAVAQHKAETSAKWPYSTREWGEWSFGKDGNPALALIPGVVAFARGLPIKTANGTPIGAIGVSGDHPPPIDEQCAQAGLDAAKDMLK